MFRPAIGTLIIAATLGMAWQAAAELPMSPVFRPEQTAHPGQSRPQPATAQSEKQTAGGKAADVPAADSGKVVATAAIPPPPPPIPAAAELPAMPSPIAPPEQAAASPHTQRHASRRHYAYSHYRYVYPFGAGSAATPPHLGPNPYSDSGD